MRIFYLEPFLIKPERHFIEATLAIDHYLSIQTRYEYYIVGHKNLNHVIKKYLPHTFPSISQTCFEDLEDKGRTFFRDLVDLDKRFFFRSNDLLVISTAYENQLLGVSEFVKCLDRKCPKIALQFHQLFPPTNESDNVANLSFRRYWIARLRKAFAQINNPNVSYWTTEVKRLNKDFRRISGRRAGLLPFPQFTKIIQKGKVGLKSKNIVVGFLGEGRQEKGLLLFLKVVQKLTTLNSSLQFIIQIMNPRGFTIAQKDQLDRLLETLIKLPSVNFFNGGISPVKFRQLLQSLDVLVLPYNPVHYCRRLSGLVVTATIYNKPVIVSSETWASYAVQKKWASGMVFKYDSKSEKRTISNIIGTINKFVKDNKYRPRTDSQSSSPFVLSSNGQTFISRIISYYENT